MTQAEMFYSFALVEDREHYGPGIWVSISAPGRACWRRGDG